MGPESGSSAAGRGIRLDHHVVNGGRGGVVGIVGLNDPVVFVLILEGRCVYCEDFKQARWGTWDRLQRIGVQYVFERLKSVQLYASPSLNSHSVARDGAPVHVIFKVESSAKLRSPE
jgi:hypothetical protein